MDIFSPLLGGAIIGLAASFLLVSHGRVAGISGIVGSVLGPFTSVWCAWRVPFLGGLFFGGLVMGSLMPSTIVAPMSTPSVFVVVAGLLVGVGTQMGNGCTSGHGVCGIARASPRSMIATITFMATGFFSASFLSSWIGGAG